MSDAVTTRVYLVRHCDVRNPDGVLYGHLDDFPLSDHGVRQAHVLGRGFADSGITRITSSPLERARQTSEIIASYIPGSEISVDADLVEAEFGRYLQGVKFNQIPWRRPLWLIHMIWPGILPNDERVATMAARVGRVVRRTVVEHPGTGGICVSHGDPIQAFWLQAEGRHPYALHRLQCGKGGYLALDYVGDRLTGKAYTPPPDPGAELPGDGDLSGTSHA